MDYAVVQCAVLGKADVINNCYSFKGCPRVSTLLAVCQIVLYALNASDTHLTSVLFVQAVGSPVIDRVHCCHDND